MSSFLAYSSNFKYFKHFVSSFICHVYNAYQQPTSLMFILKTLSADAIILCLLCYFGW